MNEKKLTKEQKEKMKKYAVFALMGIICAGFMWFIFSPSAKEKAKKEQTAGFNADIPMPKEGNMINDKREAYEKEQVKQRQEERMRSLQDFSALLGDSSTSKKEVDLSLMNDNAASSSSKSKGEGITPIQKSVNAYKDINRSLGNFYETPKKDPEKEALKRQIEELQAKVNDSENGKNEEDRQLKIMEKSMQMAAKYMPGAVGTTEFPATSVGAAAPAKELPAAAKEKTAANPAAVPVAGVRGKTVSMLQPEMSNEAFMETFSQPRNLGFLTAATDTTAPVKNTVSACVHSDQTLMDGQYVRIRLLEPIKAGNILIPEGTLISGMSKIQGERMDIFVSTLEYAGMIIPVKLQVYDTDGQQGIFIPDLQELSAVKEIAANMGTNAGTSINLSNDAGEQFVADMGRNLIQGVSQFASKKLREIKVHLKAGYRIFLMPGKN